MIEAATLFMPDGGSLLTKVMTFQSMHDAYSQAETSLKMADDPKWADSLGEKHEIEDALRISRSSLAKATQAITRADLQQAQDDELITREQAITIAQMQRQFSVQAERQTAKQEAKHQHRSSFKQSQ